MCIDTRRDSHLFSIYTAEQKADLFLDSQSIHDLQPPKDMRIKTTFQFELESNRNRECVSNRRDTTLHGIDTFDRHFHLLVGWRHSLLLLWALCVNST